MDKIMNKGINVLSLFDGISCGQIALERAGIKVDKYYASEIDKHAIKVTQHNYPNTIQLGDINDWENWQIDWFNIDLLTAGFPCQSWSLAVKQAGINDPRGNLALVLCEIFKKVKENNPDLKFLFENVQMKKEYEDFLNNLFGVPNIKINSALVSAQNRKRLYWTNIENIKQPEDKQIYLSDILDNSIPFDKEYYFDPYKQHAPVLYTSLKYKCLVAQGGGRTKERAVSNEIGQWRHLTQNEGEKLQTVPIGYTSPISKNQAFKCLGNGWTVDVIAHIFSFLPKEFKNG